MARWVTAVLDRLDAKERITFLDELAIPSHDGGDDAANFGLDFIEDLHRFHDADWLARLDRFADLGKWLGGGGGCAVEYAGKRCHYRYRRIGCGRLRCVLMV